MSFAYKSLGSRVASWGIDSDASLIISSCLTRPVTEPDRGILVQSCGAVSDGSRGVFSAASRAGIMGVEPVLILVGNGGRILVGSGFLEI